jgi:cytochrome c oxidase cbb3-type subunit IV
MDLNDIRSAVTVLLLVAFAGICAWAWSRSREQAFNEAARLPLDGEQAHE